MVVLICCALQFFECLCWWIVARHLVVLAGWYLHRETVTSWLQAQSGNFSTHNLMLSLLKIRAKSFHSLSPFREWVQRYFFSHFICDSSFCLTLPVSVPFPLLRSSQTWSHGTRSCPSRWVTLTQRIWRWLSRGYSIMQTRHLLWTTWPLTSSTRDKSCCSMSQRSRHQVSEGMKIHFLKYFVKHRLNAPRTFEGTVLAYGKNECVGTTHSFLLNVKKAETWATWSN